MNYWRLYWLIFLLGGFLVPETVALIRKRPGDTLSEAVWHWCQVTPGNTFTTWTALHVLVAFFMVWLFVHLVLGYWR